MAEEATPIWKRAVKGCLVVSKGGLSAGGTAMAGKGKQETKEPEDEGNCQPGFRCWDTVSDLGFPRLLPALAMCSVTSLPTALLIVPVGRLFFQVQRAQVWEEGKVQRELFGIVGEAGVRREGKQCQCQKGKLLERNAVSREGDPFN